MATIKPSYGTVTPLTITLNSLASNVAKESTAVNNETDLFLDVGLDFEFTLATGLPGGLSGNSPAIQIYAYFSIDKAGTYSEPATGTNNTITINVTNNLVLLETFFTPLDKTASASWKCHIPSLTAKLGFMPSRWGVVVQNLTDKAFHTSGNLAEYIGYNVVSV